MCLCRGNGKLAKAAKEQKSHTDEHKKRADTLQKRVTQLEKEKELAVEKEQDMQETVDHYVGRAHEAENELEDMQVERDGWKTRCEKAEQKAQSLADIVLSKDQEVKEAKQELKEAKDNENKMAALTNQVNSLQAELAATKGTKRKTAPVDASGPSAKKYKPRRKRDYSVVKSRKPKKAGKSKAEVDMEVQVE